MPDAAREIERYLADEIYKDMYAGSVRERILKVLAEMNHLREELDRPPR